MGEAGELGAPSAPYWVPGLPQAVTEPSWCSAANAYFAAAMLTTGESGEVGAPEPPP